MLDLEELKLRPDLVDSIDWDMTPEEAVRLYLEWGNNWASGNYVIRSENDISYYFVINNWGENPVIYFIKRNEKEAKEIAKIEMPEHLTRYFFEINGPSKGVFKLDNRVKKWLKNHLLG